MSHPILTQWVAAGDQATVGGGSINDATGYIATVGGGLSNEAAGDYATVGGGSYHVAECVKSFETPKLIN